MMREPNESSSFSSKFNRVSAIPNQSLGLETIKIPENVHGGIDYEELLRLGLSPDEVIDFSSNLLPYGAAPGVVKAIRDTNFSSYPDRDCCQLKRAISDRYGVDRETLLIGNGCCDLIHQVALGFVRPGDSVLVVGPTFSEYERASRIAGGNVQRCDAASEDGFVIPIAKISKTLARQSFRIVWICNPNNPTGQSVSAQVILDWLEQFPQTVFALDESYIEFTEGIESLIACNAVNLIVLRSMTKAYALAGLRLGYAAVREPWISILQARSVPWSVNAIAQAAGIAALNEHEYYDAAMLRLSESKRKLIEVLTQQGFRITPSETGYFLMATGNPPQLRERLLSFGLLIRDCSSFGLNGFVRIAVRTDEQNKLLVARLTNQEVQNQEIQNQKVRFPPNGNRESAEFTPELNTVSNGNEAFLSQLNQLFHLRRDVRHFRSDPLGGETMRQLLESACLAPSVGFSQPWRFISVTSAACRTQVITEFEAENEMAASKYDDATQAEYRLLKLAGLREAPEHLAVFIHNDPITGRGLGRATMPESVAYSVVSAIQNLWLAARAQGIGVGWVSILRPEAIASILEVSDDWQLIAYLCIGYPMDEHASRPELERLGWESRISFQENWTQR